ncbi:MAG: Gfo/Idh/MocA family oxidoreductase [Elusimicrobiota bacterium]|jgi:predicted dehydrogenase|nr:Gfo/Idh/MocA family oxidoreductase [Elusimicrobiota bacterium]
MEKIKIGVLGASDIAFRKFLPALLKEQNFKFVALASHSPQKTVKFSERFNAAIFDDYDAIIENKDIDAIYMPLPPAYHFQYAKKALECGKHIFLEKPLTLSHQDGKTLVSLAQKKGLALMENYAFLYHPQLQAIKNVINSDEIGSVRFVRCSFCFPFRGLEDFRYNKSLGGGALFDCGVYTIKAASYFLGSETKVKAASLFYENAFEVDIFGSGFLDNEISQTAQIAFGMDNIYKCEMEIYGSKGNLFTGRIFTAPEDLKIQIKIDFPKEQRILEIEPQDQFQLSIRHFAECIMNDNIRNEEYKNILLQSALTQDFLNLGGK